MIRMTIVLVSIFVITFASKACSQNPELVGGPCEGCEAVFEYGNRELTVVDTLPVPDHAGEKLKITGTIYQPDGETPAEDVILYIYHTDSEGVYPTLGDEEGWANRHGYLRGWIQTDESGEYSFYTTRPGSYSSNPAHIHATILEPDGDYYYIDEIRFEEDPSLENVREYMDGRGGSGVVSLQRKNGIWVAERDIVLGQNVPGYK